MPDPQSLPQSPRVSFIIPAYNVPAPLLLECLSGVLSLGAGEVIVVDDGSDTPVDTVLPYATKQAIRLLRQPHSGQSVARNTGIEAARGVYIQFVDADDRLNCDDYRRVIAMLHQENPDVLVFGHTVRREDGRESRPGRWTDGTGSGMRRYSGPSYVAGHNLRAAPWGYVFLRQMLFPHGIHGHLRFTPGITTEDEEFTPLLFLRAERLCVLGARAYSYRQHRGSLVHDQSQQARRLADTLRVIARLQRHAGQLSVADERRGRALTRRVDQLSMDYLYNTWRYTHDMSRLRDAAGSLRQLGLFPLPRRRHTWKYWLFALFTRLLVRPQ